MSLLTDVMIKPVRHLKVILTSNFKLQVSLEEVWKRGLLAKLEIATMEESNKLIETTYFL